jgi:hypothetical protein
MMYPGFRNGEPTWVNPWWSGYWENYNGVLIHNHNRALWFWEM